MTYYLLLIFISDYRNVTQKANSSNIFFSSKCIIKQQRQLTTLTIHLAQELLTNVYCRSLTKDTRDLKMRRAVAGHRNRQWPTESITEPDPLTVIPDAAEELNVDHSVVILHLKQTGKVKKFHKWVPHKLTTNQKTSFELSYSMQQYQKWILYNWQQPAQWLDREAAPKHFPKTNLCQKNLFLVIWCSFDPLQFSESRWKHYIWKVCSANWWDAPKTASLQSVLANKTGPLLHNNA